MMGNKWIGTLEGITVREPGPDANGPILELHGGGQTAALEIDDEQLVDRLTEALAEINLVLDNE